MLIDLLDPRQIAHEEGVGVHPHPAVVVEHQQSVEVRKTRLSKGGFALHELELGLCTLGQVVINTFAVEQNELPVVLLGGGPHGVDAELGEHGSLVEVTMPKDPYFVREDAFLRPCLLAIKSRE